MNSRNGFSLLELLAATVILGVLISVVLAPLGQLFRNTARSGQTLRVTTQAQEVVEYIRGQWQSYPRLLDSGDANGDSNVGDQNVGARLASQGRYDRTCFSTPPFENLALNIRVRALDHNAAETGTLAWNSTCTNAPATNPPLMKRVTVTLTAGDGSRSTLTLDIPRP